MFRLQKNLSSTEKTSKLSHQSIKIKRPHKTLTIKQKVEVLKRLNTGESVQNLSKEYQVGVTTIKDWRKNKDLIMNFEKSMTIMARKTLKTGYLLEVNDM